MIVLINGDDALIAHSNGTQEKFWKVEKVVSENKVNNAYGY